MGLTIIVLIVAAVIIGLVIFLYTRILAFLKSLIVQLKSEVLSEIGLSFGSVSRDALKENTEQFLTLAEDKLKEKSRENVQALENKKELIDNTLNQIKSEMDKVEGLITTLEKDRVEKFGELTQRIRDHAAQTELLTKLTGDLNSVLTDTRVRGQWGQRIAEDILNLVGMVENIDFVQQKQIQDSRNRPDFTFILPGGKKVNMDAKFPLNNFISYVESDNQSDRDNYMKEYINDARKSIKSVTTRDYINIEQSTLDFVIVFIPHEQGYAFLMENDRSFMDYALKLKVIVCSPWTLYAILAIMKKSIEDFKTAESANEIIGILKNFNKQWGLFAEALDGLGKKIESTHNEFDKISTTRKNQLEKYLTQIDELTRQKGLISSETTEE